MTPHIAVILTNAERNILWVNDDFTTITGYTLGEVMGKKPSILQGPKSEQDAIQRIRKGLESQVVFKDTITNYRKNGEEYPCRLIIHPIFDESHNLTNFIAFEVDGTAVDDDLDISLFNLEEKYQSSSLRGTDEIKLYLQLKEYLKQEKSYLDPNLSLREVADQLATNTKYLSQVVNHQANCNFQYFLNTYRVEEAKAKIVDDEYNNLTLYGIALQCGFKNKSTFYKVFKEITGHTPKSYLKDYKQKQPLQEEQ